MNIDIQSNKKWQDICIERSKKYLSNYIKDDVSYSNFLLKLSEKELNKFLHCFHYYSAHDFIQRTKENNEPQYIIFNVLITFSIIEYLMQSTKGQWVRIKTFFNTYLTDKEIQFLNKKITYPKKLEVPAIRILYDMRNEFIHNAKWFYLNNETGFATVHSTHDDKGNSNYTLIQLQYGEYLDIFWKSFIRYFSNNTNLSGGVFNLN